MISNRISEYEITYRHLKYFFCNFPHILYASSILSRPINEENKLSKLYFLTHILTVKRQTDRQTDRQQIKIKNFFFLATGKRINIDIPKIHEHKNSR